MKNYSDYLALDREIRFPLRDEIRADVKTLETIYDESVSAGQPPRETVRILIEKIGFSRASAAVGTLVNHSSEWDSRISRKNAAWAAGLENAWDNETAFHMGVYTIRIHMAHLNQIADAMRKAENA